MEVIPKYNIFLEDAYTTMFLEDATYSHNFAQIDFMFIPIQDEMCQKITMKTYIRWNIRVSTSRTCILGMEARILAKW